MNYLFRNLAPGAALVALAVAGVHFEWLALPAGALAFGCYVACLATALLAWRFHASRLAIAAVLTAGAVLALRLVPQTAGIVSVLLPLDLAALALTPELGFAGAAPGAWAAVLTSETIALAVMARGAIAPQWQQPLPGEAWRWVHLPAATVLAFTFALAVLLARYIMRPRAADAGLFWALAACLPAMRAAGSAGAFAYLAAAGVVLGVAVIESSYFLAFHDELTGLPSRRAFNQQLLTLDARYAIAVVDVDHFKKFNDLFGHDTGDQVLRMVAARLGHVTGGGRAFRCGGEEFAVVFPGRGVREALPHLEKVREKIEETIFTVRGLERADKSDLDRFTGTPRDRRSARRRTPERDVRVTISMGVAQPARDRALTMPDEVVTAADEALYRAKAAGRNRIEMAGGSKDDKPAGEIALVHAR